MTSDFLFNENETTNLTEIDILRLSLVDDEDFTILDSLYNQNLQKKVSNEFKNKLIKKAKDNKKNMPKIHIPNAKITNIRNTNKQNRDKFEADIETQYYY